MEENNIGINQDQATSLNTDAKAMQEEALKKLKNADPQTQLIVLRSFFEKINNEVVSRNSAEFADGHMEIVDMKYNLLLDGTIIFDIELMHNGETSHEYYSKDITLVENLDEILEHNKQMLAAYEQEGFDVEELSKNADVKNGISLNELEAKEADRLEKEKEEEAKELDLEKEQIALVNEDGQNKVKVDAEALKGDVMEIDGNTRVSTYQNLNEVLNMQYDSYKLMVLPNGNHKVFGIKDGIAEEIQNDSLVYDKEIRTMSLLRPDGQSQAVGVKYAFRVRDLRKEGAAQGDYVLGAYNRGSSNAVFMGRGGLNDERIIGEEIPGSKYYAANAREIERVFDYKLNKDIETEQETAREITTDEKNADNDQVYKAEENYTVKDEEELINEYADYYGLEDIEVIEEKVDEIQKESPEQDIEETVAQAAEEAAEEKLEELKKEQEVDHGERSLEDLDPHNPDSPMYRPPIF